MIRRKPPVQPVPAAVEAQPAPVDHAAEARRLTAAADQLTADAADARERGEQLVAEARAQAERLVAEAEQTARQLAADHRGHAHRAEQLNLTAGYHREAAQLQDDLAQAEGLVVALSAEADDLRGQVADIDCRQVELGTDREATGVQLAAARADGDVNAVSWCRTRLSALDEVAADLEQRRTAILGRLEAIGDPDGIGQLHKAVARALDRRAGLRRVLNLLDPSRPEAQADEITAVILANFERLAEEAQRTPEPARVRVSAAGVLS